MHAEKIMTSRDNPLWIDALELERGGVIGMTFCPGKKAASGYGGWHDRDLATDLAAISAWRPAAVVTLMTGEELRRYGVEELGQAVREAGIGWYHLPIEDASVPGRRFERRWRGDGMRLRQLLRAGERILLHCRGGLGRTGMIAARLLVELGMEPDEAIARVHEVRGDRAIEDQQEGHVRASRAIPPERDLRHARVLACLLGGALGDALGYRVEFDSLDGIRARYGSKGITPGACQEETRVVSDDTQMTLFALEGMLRARGGSPGEALDSLRLAWLDWYGTQQSDAALRTCHGRLGYEPVLHYRRVPGSGTMAALSGGGRGTLESPENDYKGCGTVMRVAPVGFFPEWLDEEATFGLAMRSAAITHGHRSAALAAGAMALVIRYLLLGEELEGAALQVLVRLQDEPGHEEVTRALGRALTAARAGGTDHPALIDQLWGDPALAHKASRGWVAEEALAIGLYAALAGGDLDEVITIAANHSGDSDSTASVAGQLWGAWHGETLAPALSARSLDVGVLIEELAARCPDR